MKLFLDDERYPTDLYPEDDDWILIRNVPDMRWYIRTYGLPTEMSLDHDLGPGKETGYDFVKWFVNDILIDGDVSYQHIGFRVHSMNPVGAKNMQAYWDNFLRDYW